MKVRDVIKLLKEDGWLQISQKGSHRQFRHLVKKGKVTVPGKLADDLQISMLKSIFKQAGIDR
ncbi:MAG: type II toxin-antitoxin system HicA family toxin [Candidatus Magnetoovum sp. WYHC-5]|nr:type II toxin-antitoxin system HicA family toxin [Candidatus Magnetoovum sp. WYHC-5]